MIEPYDSRPRSASNRAYLRDGLPTIYRDGAFGMRFVEGLEEVLDPVVCLLDALPAHFHPDLAPDDVLGLLAAWIGLDVEDVRAPDRRREIVRRAPDLGRRRGTRRGLELLLQLAFPELGLRVHDGGGVSWSSEPDRPPPSAPMFEVAAEVPLTAEQAAALERMVAPRGDEEAAG